MTTITNAKLSGVTDLADTPGGDYIRLIRVGAGTPGNANATGDLYLTRALEVDGTFYMDGAATIYGQAHTMIVPSATANALTIGRGGSSAYIRIDTLSAQTEMFHRMEYNTASGIANRAIAGLDILRTRQGDWLKYNLASGNGAAAMLSAPNPYSGTRCIITDWFLGVEKVTSGCSHISIGITSGVSTVGNLMLSGPITQVSAYPRTRTTKQGGSGNSGMPIVWQAGNVLNVTASAGAAAGASNFSGHLYVQVKKVD